MSQFTNGETVSLGGLTFRVSPGSKGPDDLVVEVFTPHVYSSGEWRPVEMRIVGMLHAFFCENEDRLYPPPRFLGADCWRAWLRLCETDWRSADKKLAREKAAADRKRRGVVDDEYMAWMKAEANRAHDDALNTLHSQRPLFGETSG